MAFRWLISAIRIQPTPRLRRTCFPIYNIPIRLRHLPQDGEDFKGWGRNQSPKEKIDKPRQRPCLHFIPADRRAGKNAYPTN